MGGRQPPAARHPAPTAHAPPGSPPAALLADAHRNTRAVATRKKQQRKRTHVCSALSSAGGPSCTYTPHPDTHSHRAHHQPKKTTAVWVGETPGAASPPIRHISARSATGHRHPSGPSNRGSSASALLPWAPQERGRHSLTLPPPPVAWGAGALPPALPVSPRRPHTACPPSPPRAPRARPAPSPSERRRPTQVAAGPAPRAVGRRLPRHPPHTHHPALRLGGHSPFPPSWHSLSATLPVARWCKCFLSPPPPPHPVRPLRDAPNVHLESAATPP